MISTEITTKENDIYWLTSSDMINLLLVTKYVGVHSVSDNSKNINQINRTTVFYLIWDITTQRISIYL